MGRILQPQPILLIRNFSDLARQTNIARPGTGDSTLKREMLQCGEFINEADARTELFSYIEGYYNTRRKHSSLGYRTPSQYELTTLKN